MLKIKTDTVTSTFYIATYNPKTRFKEQEQKLCTKADRLYTSSRKFKG